MAAVLVMGVRVLVSALAVGLVAFVLIAWTLGPMTPLVGLSLGWAIIFGLTAAAIGWSLAPLRGLRGHGALGLVGQEEPALLSPLQTAFELQDDTRFSPDLVAAQRQSLLRDLEHQPARRFIPWRWVVQPAFVTALLLGLLAWWSLGFDRAAAGRYALLHVDRGGDGVPIRQVVARTGATLTYPDYMDRPSERLSDADRLSVPRGTGVKYSVLPIGDASRVVLELPGRHVQAERDGDGFVASFVADIEGPIQIYVESSSGERRADYRARSIDVYGDEPPRVRMRAPDDDMIVEARDPIVIGYEASDDYGVQELTLLIKLPSGEHLRRQVYGPPETAQTGLAGEMTLYLDEFSLAPADAVTIWLEAKDSNRIDGPGQGQSEERTLTLASDITRRRDQIVELERLLDELLSALAVRLETPLPKDPRLADRRLAAVAGEQQKVLDLLFDVADHPGPRTVPLLLDMRKRLERLSRREATIYRGYGGHGPKKRVEDLTVAELENDSLVVADLISEARLHDASEIAREMRELRREISSLISELRRGQTPELQRALMAALDRAERRMQSLKQQLAEAMQYVPGEFVNQQSRQADESTDALESLREALASGDLEAAEEALERLDQTIEAMAQALSQTEDSLVEARFGPRERALMEAMDTIRDLEVEQRRMAEQSRQVGDRAARRAAAKSAALGAETRKALGQQATRVRDEIDGLPKGAMGPYERSLQQRAEERLDDFESALESGDLGEALSMAQQAARAAEDLAKDLELSAMMFRGQAGKTAEAAATARQAAAGALDLRDATKAAIPDVRGALSGREREGLQQQAERQAAAQEAAHQLARRLREEVGGVPVSEQAAEQLESIERPMQRAGQELEADDPLEANKQQEAAAEQLRRLRQDLESRQRKTSSGDGTEGTRGAKPPERVQIPESRSKADELAWRRRVLDARKGDAPDGYEPAVQDYYERLLR